MDSTTFTSRLQSSLGALVSSVFDSPVGLLYDVATLNTAMWRAVVQYSSYYPARRRIREGIIASDVAAAANTLLVLGGPIVPGDFLVLGLDYPETPEALVVQSVSPMLTVANLALPAVSVTTSTSTLYAHAGGGSFILSRIQPSPVASVVSDGIALTANQERYGLPPDFIRPDSDSIDSGLNIRGSKADTFYDGVYNQTEQLSGVGYGQSSNYGFLSPYGYPARGTPPGFDATGNAIQGGGLFAGDISWEIAGGSRPFIRINPAPQYGLLRFDYFGYHSVATIPEQDAEKCLYYARYAALDYAASFMASELETQGDGNAKQSTSSGALSKLAMAQLERWDIEMRLRPRVMSG